MLGLGLFFGGAMQGRNVNTKLKDPHPVRRYPDCQHSGNAGLDGYTRISRADPTNQGRERLPPGAIEYVSRGPSEDFEQ